MPTMLDQVVEVKNAVNQKLEMLLINYLVLAEAKVDFDAWEWKRD